MNLLILNGPRDNMPGQNVEYRGTYRAHPFYVNELSAHAEVNELFLWFVDEGGELGVVRDLSKAQRLAQLFNQWSGRTLFEVLEVTKNNARPELAGEFLGYDLSAAYNSSLLVSGLSRSPSLDSLPSRIRDLAILITDHYAPLLNRNGLFEHCESAASALKSMIALQELSPNLYEGDALTAYCPTALYKL
jgi:hypothetical protein